MKILLEKVKIYGYDPNIFKTFTNNGVETKQYSVGLYISEEQKFLIDSYIYGKCETTKDGEILFYGKNKQPIPVFDQNKQKIEKPVNEVFLADVSILIDEFTDKNGEQIRYSKCLGIKYISPVAGESTRVVSQTKYETYDEIFGGNEAQNDIRPNDPAHGLIKKEDYISEPPRVVVPEEQVYDPTANPDDLPF